MQSLKRVLYIGLLLAAATPWCGPATALAAGIVFSLLLGNPWPGACAAWSRRLLQGSVAGLGFGVSLTQVWHAGREAVFYTPVSIILTVALGLLLGRMLATPPKASALISFGTAICGGSAIAAMAPVIQADDEDMAVALATVFSLNAVALLLFPPLGQLLGLTERQFGLWSALAIHDTSSVVGAASAYGVSALAIGTTVKLARAVWIAPSVLVAARIRRRQSRAGIPLFILGYLVAASLRSFFPFLLTGWEILAEIARQGLVVALFLIGNGLTRDVLHRVGIRPLAQAAILWVIVSTSVWYAVSVGIIR